MATREESYRAARLLRAGPAAPAFAWLVEFLVRSPAEPFLLNLAGVRAFSLGRYDDAAALLERAYSLDPDIPSVGANLIAALAAAPGGALDARVRDVAERAQPAEGLTLSLCMIVRDEESSIGACLESALPFVDEAIVVDTGSTDRTAEIAASLGARVVPSEWRDSFAAARNRSLAEASGEWILYLDADERLLDGAALRASLGRTWREGFLLEVENATGEGRGTRHASLRVFRNRAGYRFEGRIHERLRGFPYDLGERLERLPVRILHSGYRPERVHGRAKPARNLRLLALESTDAPGPYTSFNLGSELLRLGDWDAAARHLDASWAAICGLDWSDLPWAPVLALRAARAHREAGRPASARRVLLAALDRVPAYTDLLFELACCEVASGREHRAVSLFERCLELGDADPELLATIGAGGALAEAALEDLKSGLDLPMTAPKSTTSDGGSMSDGISAIGSGDAFAQAAARRVQAKPSTPFTLAAGSKPTPEAPPPEVLAALDSAARVHGELSARGLNVSFDVQDDGGVRVSVVDADGRVVRELSPAHAVDLLGSARAVQELG